MNDKPFTVWYSILIYLAIILVGCQVLLNTAPSPTDTTTQYTILSATAQVSTSTPVELENGWYLYNDPDGEFSFAYPPTAILSAGQNPVDFSKNITIQFLLPEKPYQGMSIRLEPNPKRLQGAEIAQQLYEKSAQKPASAEFTNSLQQIQIAGISAIQAHIPSSNTEVTVIIPYDVKVFLVSPVHEPSVPQVEKETLDLYYQVLNSMKFGSSQ